MRTSLTVLKAKIEINLKRNNPKKYGERREGGKLSQWLQKGAEQAAEAMSSTTDEANLSQRAELATEYLNPPAESQEEEPEIEESQEDAWLNSREQKVVVTVPSDVRHKR
jgi:hypothetical protein